MTYVFKLQKDNGNILNKVEKLEQTGFQHNIPSIYIMPLFTITL